MIRMKHMTAVIILIFFLGVIITSYTRSVTEVPEDSANLSSAAARQAAVSETTVISPIDTYTEEEEDYSGQEGFPETAGVVEGVPKNKEKSQEERASEMALAIAPVEESGDRAKSGAPEISVQAAAGGAQEEKGILADGSLQEETAAEEGAALEKTPYAQRLEELENQARKLQPSNGDSSQYVRQRAAESVYKLWDGELNRIYSIILNSITKEEAEALAKEEREWMASREQEAAKASKDSSMESLEYRSVLAGMTRERVYELGERYGHLLEEE